MPSEPRETEVNNSIKAEDIQGDDAVLFERRQSLSNITMMKEVAPTPSKVRPLCSTRPQDSWVRS